ncbi:recombinase RecT [Streptomyces althioticus]|uniref:recombinase RecT n=1 Tax=Streptomyces althioticus TaxID=83380 RepID=UPI0033EA0668
MNSTPDMEVQDPEQGVQHDTTTEKGTPQGWTEAEHQALDTLGVPTDRAGRALLYETAKRTGLSPFARQIYLTERDNGRLSVETTIDGLRAIAENHGMYAGQVGPQWCGPNGKWQDVWVSNKPPTGARVGILRKDCNAPIWGVALWAEYAGDNPPAFYKRMPAHMLAKVAEALGLRRTFPQDLGGLYTNDEIFQRDTGPAPRGASFGPTRTHRGPNPQDAVARAEQVSTSQEVYEVYEKAGQYRLLGHPIAAPDTKQQEQLGFYLLRQAAAKARDVDTVRGIYREAERVGVLTMPVPAGQGMPPVQLRDHLAALDNVLRHATGQGDTSEQDAPPPPAPDPEDAPPPPDDRDPQPEPPAEAPAEKAAPAAPADQPKTTDRPPAAQADDEWDEPFETDPSRDLDPIRDLDTLSNDLPGNPWDGVPGTWGPPAVDPDDPTSWADAA